MLAGVAVFVAEDTPPSSLAATAIEGPPPPLPVPVTFDLQPDGRVAVFSLLLLVLACVIVLVKNARALMRG